MRDNWDLERFVAAQDAHGTYGRAADELRRGRKVSHWMWFVFPQVAGLGHSTTARHFAIGTLAEARAYLDHPVLGARLHECVSILLEGSGDDAAEILGPIDALKLRSSMTLFHRARPDDGAAFSEVLDRYFDGQPDAATDRRLAESGDGP